MLTLAPGSILESKTFWCGVLISIASAAKYFGVELPDELFYLLFGGMGVALKLAARKAEK